MKKTLNAEWVLNYIAQELRHTLDAQRRYRSLNDQYKKGAIDGALEKLISFKSYVQTANHESA